MRCPSCKYMTFDYLDVCPKCNADLSEIGSKLCRFRGEPQYSIWMWLQVPAGEDLASRDQEAASEIVMEEDYSLREAGADESDEMILVVDDDMVEVVSEEEEVTPVEEIPESEPAGLDDLEDFGPGVPEAEAVVSEKMPEIKTDLEQRADEAIADEQLEKLLADLEGEEEDLGEILLDLESGDGEALAQEEVKEKAVEVASPETTSEKISEEIDENLDIEISDLEDLEINMDDLEVIEEDEEEGKKDSDN